MVSAKKPHVLMVTLPLYGHFPPFVQILYHMSERYRGVTVTVLGNKDHIGDLKALQSKGNLRNLDLRLLEVFGEIPIYSADQKFPARPPMVAEANGRECESFRKKLVEQKDSVGAPTFIVSDLFQYWSKDLADELGIPCYLYFPSCAIALTWLTIYPQILKEGDGGLPNDFISVRGLTFSRNRDIPQLVLAFPDFYNKLTERLKRVTGILVNSSEDLEGTAGTFQALQTNAKPVKVLAIGPTVQLPGFGFTYQCPSSASNCLDWLDSRSSSSVLYIAFGTIGLVSKSMVTALATGLEASGVAFLWALKVAPADLTQLLPQGFLERSKEQGLIETGWVPQVRILAHPATGGFLTHAGWNSTLESICAGVPLIAWPFFADQPFNTRFITNVAKVGFNVSMFKATNKETFEDITCNEITKVIRLLMLEKEGQGVRSNVVELKKLLSKSVVEGSSHHNLQYFLNLITYV